MTSVSYKPSDVPSEHDLPLNATATDHAMHVDPLDVQRSSNITSPGDNEHEIPEGFTLVKSKRKRNDSSSTSSDCTIITGQVLNHGLTVILKPKDPATLITKINPLKLHEKLESISPDGLIRVRPNPRLNLLALDTRNTAATKDFLGLTCIGKVEVQAYEPRPNDSSVGIIHGVSTEISDADLQTAVRTTVPVQNVRRLGSSEVVKLIFSTARAPVHVLIGYTRFAVQPYVEKPLRCPKCFRLGHVAGACNKSTCCSRCGGDHEHIHCTAEHPRCTNCKKQHSSTSLNCPVYKLEAAICHHKSEHHTNYWTAKKAVLSRNDSTPSGELQKLKTPVVAQHVSSSVHHGELKTALPSRQDPLVQEDRTTDFPLLGQEPSPVALGSTSSQSPAPNRDGDHNKNKPLIPRQRRSAPSVQTHGAAPYPSSSTSLGATLCTILELISKLLSSLTSPIAQAIKSVIDIALPLVTSWCA